MEKLVIEKIEDGWLLTSIHQKRKKTKEVKWAILCDHEPTDKALVDSIIEELGRVVEDPDKEDLDEDDDTDECE